MKKLLCITVALAVFMVGCTRTRGMKITESNQEEVIAKVARAKDIPQEEKQMLVGYFLRSKMGSMLGAEACNPVGRTVGQIIDEQKAYIAKQEEREEREKQLALEEKAKEEAMISELKKSIMVTPYALQKDEDRLFPGVELRYTCANTGSKDIRAFRGRLVITDILGSEVADVEVKSLAPLKAGARRNESDFLPTMVYGSVRGKKYEDLKFVWKPETVILSDGTTLGELPRVEE
jgi:hypothetical protein